MGPRGYCGIGIYMPKHEVNQGTLWRSAYAFGANFIFTVGRRFEDQSSDTAKTWKHVPMVNYLDVDDLIKHLPNGCHLVGVELDARAKPLSSFVHPERAVYLCGREDYGLPPAVLSRCHHVVQLPGLRICLNVATAGSLVLYDRAAKRSHT